MTSVATPGGLRRFFRAMMVPFKISEVHGGVSHAFGTLYLEDEFLVIEYRIHVMDMFKRPPETIKIELGVISDIEFKQSLFGDRVRLLPKKLSVLDAVPGKHKDVVTFKTKKKYREPARRLVNEIRIRRLERS
ncbi:MAG: hypothetical protein HKN17_05000 [Rhodothermales bacterium]|nr:hypothetical protein [Rhodothermales bacterium]